MPETIEIQLKKGVLTLCVLALLNRHDSYAYEIASTFSGEADGCRPMPLAPGVG